LFQHGVAAHYLSSLHGEFIKGIRDDMEGVETIIEHFCGTASKFALLVTRKYDYKRSLAVKSVEAISASKTVPMWTEKCQPNKLVDTFWRSHMLSPCKYAADGMAVFGEIIDYDGSYINPSEHEGSDYQNKRDVLFKFELDNFPERDYFCGRLGDKGTARGPCCSAMTSILDMLSRTSFSLLSFSLFPISQRSQNLEIL
jgi:hypothetical protein